MKQEDEAETAIQVGRTVTIAPCYMRTQLWLGVLQRYPGLGNKAARQFNSLLRQVILKSHPSPCCITSDISILYYIHIWTLSCTAVLQCHGAFKCRRKHGMEAGCQAGMIDLTPKMPGFSEARKAVGRCKEDPSISGYARIMADSSHPTYATVL